MAQPPVELLPGRRPVYPVDTEDEAPVAGRPVRKPQPEGSPDDPASDANTQSANHPNDE